MAARGGAERVRALSDELPGCESVDVLPAVHQGHRRSEHRGGRRGPAAGGIESHSDPHPPLYVATLRTQGGIRSFSWIDEVLPSPPPLIEVERV